MADMADPRTPRRDLRDPRLVALAEDSGYEILGRIGTGGMGIVYRAHDADGHEVAIKLLRHEIAEDPRARERLAREVAAQQRVRNDSIVRILDAELDSADAFVVTEFVPGPTLEDAVRVRGGLHPEAVREIGLVLGESLRAIHGAGVIHRDLKPSNVLLRGAGDADLDGFDPDGDGLDPVIIDFGIAVAAEESRLTSTGLVMGTAAYLDPEVLRSDRTDEAGDWWAWAAMLAFAATGREPYGTGRADVVFLRAERGELDVDGTPVELGEWLRRALTSDPSQRPAPEELLASLAELDLERYAEAGMTEALPGTPGGGTAEDPERTSVPAPVPEESTDEVPISSPTQVLPVVPAATEALPRTATPAEPVTEVLPVLSTPTQVLPAVPAAAPPAGPPVGLGGPAGHPVQRAPQQTGWAGAPAGPMTAPVPQPQPQPQPQRAPQQMLAPQPMPGPYGAPGPYGWATPLPPAPRRPVLVWLGHLLLVGLAAVAPYVALTLMLLLGATARTWERSHRSVAEKRLRGTAGSGPLVTAGLLAPFGLLRGLVELALQALLPLILGLLVGIATDAAWTLLSGGPAPPDGVVFAIALGVTLLITWVGLGSATTRRGAHRMLDAAAPDRMWTAVLLGLLLLLLGAVIAAILARQGMVDYFPFPTGPRLEDVAVWRR